MRVILFQMCVCEIQVSLSAVESSTEQSRIIEKDKFNRGGLLTGYNQNLLKNTNKTIHVCNK